MVDDVKIKDSSVERVAFDLMEKIAMFEQDASSSGKDARRYWFKLYVQCHDAARGCSLSTVLAAGNED